MTWEGCESGKPSSPWLFGECHRSWHCVSAKLQVQPAAGTSLLCALYSTTQRLNSATIVGAARSGSSSTAEIYCLQFHTISTVSLPQVLISDVSSDHLYTFFLVLEVRNLSLMKLKGHHFFQQESAVLTVKCLIMAHANFFTFIHHILISIYTHMSLCTQNCSQNPVLLSAGPVAMHTYWKELEMFLVPVIDLHSYCLWSWSILLKFQPMFFSPAFCTVSIAISLSVFASSAAGWLCFPYA